MAGYRPPQRPHLAVLRRQSDGSVWSPDAVVKIEFAPNWQITDHPVEEGVSVSDHIRKQPGSITITAVVTENPTRVGGVSGGPARLRERLGWLVATADAGELVDVVTSKLGTFTGYAIQSAPHALDGVARLEFALQLREVRIATSTTVQIDVEAVAEDSAAGAPPEQDLGEQPTTSTATTTTEQAAEEDDRSYLAAFVDWMEAS